MKRYALKRYALMADWRTRERQQRQFDSLRERGLLPGQNRGDFVTAPEHVRLDSKDLRQLMGFYRDHCWSHQFKSRSEYQAYVRIQNRLWDRHQKLVRGGDQHEVVFI